MKGTGKKLTSAGGWNLTQDGEGGGKKNPAFESSQFVQELHVEKCLPLLRPSL